MEMEKCEMDVAKDCNDFILSIGDTVCLLSEEALNSYKIKDIAFIGRHKAVLNLTGIDGFIDSDVTMIICPEDYPAYYV